MTSRFRLLFAVFAALLALAAGVLNGMSDPEGPPMGRRNGLIIPQMAASEDVDRFVEAIFASELFPEVELRVDAPETDGTDGPQTVEELEQSLQDPSLSAFVKREDAWRIILYGVGEGAQTREIGDQLSDGWVIQDIESTSVLLVRGEQSRRIEVFKAEPGTQ